MSLVAVIVCLVCGVQHARSTKVSTRSCANQAERDAYALELAQVIVGEGINVSSASIVGVCEQFGIFSEGTSVTQAANDADSTDEVFIEYGVTISTGFADMANRSSNTEYNAAGTGVSVQPYTCDSGQNMDNDVPELYSVTCSNSNMSCTCLCDAAELRFDFEIDGGASSENLTVNYIFASEEYSEYVGYIEYVIGPGQNVYQMYSDSFAFFLDGQNIAVADDGSIVSVATINKGNPCNYDRHVDAFGTETFQKPFPAHNIHQFIDNDVWATDSSTGCDEVDACGSNFLGDLAGDFATEYDGFTKILRARRENIGTGSHTMQFSVADMNDAFVDTQVFIQAGSFSPYKIGCMDANALNYDQYAERDSGQCFYKTTPITVVVPNDGADDGFCTTQTWYKNCPALGSFTSTKNVEVTVELCDVGTSATCSSVTRMNVSAGSYNSFSMDLGQSVPVTTGESYALKFSVPLHETRTSASAQVYEYESDTVEILSPSAGSTLFGCGTYDVSWAVSDDGSLASTSAYDVKLYDSARNLHSLIGEGITSGVAQIEVDTSFASGSYSVEVTSSNFSADCIPPAVVNFTISQDVPSSVSMSLAGTDIDASMPGIQWRMCQTSYIDVIIDSTSPVEVAVKLLSDAPGGFAELSDIKSVTASGIVSFYSGPGVVAPGDAYVISTRVTDAQLAKCIPAVNATVEVLQTSIQNMTADRTRWSQVCGLEGRTYAVNWNLPVLQYVDVELCHANESSCVQLESALCSNSFIADQSFWENALFASRGAGTDYFVRVRLNSGEDACVSPATINIELTEDRDESFCPEDSAASNSSGDDVGMIVGPIAAFLFVVVVAVVIYYKFKIRNTREKARDMMVKQEIRHNQENSMNNLELPTTGNQLVCNIPGGDDSDNGSDRTDVKSLKLQNERLQRELAKEKKMRAAAELRHASLTLKSESRRFETAFSSSDVAS
eukprot:g2663.t1